MNYEQSICKKTQDGLKMIEEAVVTHSFNPQKMALLLHHIQTDATKMENALKVNKKLRLKHNIDAEYRKEMQETEVTTGTNTLDKGYTDIQVQEIPEYEIRLKQDGKVIYENNVHAFIFCSVDQIEDIDSSGIINGKVMTMAVGHDLAVWYAFDQLKQKFGAKMTELMVKMANLRAKAPTMNRAERRKLAREASKKR